MADYKSSYTGEQIDAGIAKANTAVQPAGLETALASKQDTLVSGENIKTINNQSLLGSGNIEIQGGGGDISVRNIDFSNSQEWDSEEGRPTTEVIDDILENKYTLIHVYNIPADENILIEMYLIANTMINIENSNNVRYYYKFDEGDEEEGTTPNIEQYLFMHQEGENAQMIVENFELGSEVSGTDDGNNWTTLTINGTTKNIPAGGGSGNISVYSFNEADIDQNILSYIVNNKPDVLRITTVQSMLQDYYKGQDREYYCLIAGSFITLNITGSEGNYTPEITRYDFNDFSTVSGTDDGTNWTSLTINGTTKNIPAGSAGGLSKVYVNASTGSDSNDGTSWSNAKQTFASALAVAADECTLFFEGDTQERLNIKTKASQSVLRIVGRDGVRNRIMGGTKLVDFEATETSGVYKITTPSQDAFSSNYYCLVQDNVADTSTAISSYEAHPAQKGRQYRLLSTPIPRKTSIANVISSTTGFYYNGTQLYVKPANTNFSNYPIYCPTTDGGIYGNDGTCIVEISNIEVWNCPMLITNCPNAIVTDCSCSFALGTGGIKYDDSVNVTLKRCEAAYTLNTSGYGDGINAHSNKYEALSGNTNDSKIKYVSAELIDCWCHDCSDDGWSDHSACEVIIRGGLYEYNHKGGVTPSSGGKCTCYDVMTRKNCRGFYYVSSNTYQKEKTAYFYCENCISDGEDATRVSQGITRLAGAGFSTDDVGVTVSGWKGIYSKFVNCKSMNNTIGFGAGKKSTINLIDCSTLNVTNITSLLDDGSITKYVTEPVSSAIAVTGVSINKTTQTADYNQTFTLTATVTPSNATNQNVVWSIVSGSEYISINSSGLSCSVTTGSSNGSAVVRVTTEDGSYTAQCAITIEHKELVSLTTTGTLSKTSYFAGESLDITGLTITATFNDSSSTVLSGNELSYNPDPLTIGTTSVDVSYTYGSVTKTVAVSGITVYAPLSVTWEQGAIQADIGNTNAANRIRTQGFIDLQETGSFSIKTLQGAKGCWWSYTSDATTQTRSTSSANAWVDYSEGFVISQSVVGARYVRFAIKKQDDANIVPSEADTYFEFIR